MLVCSINKQIIAHVYNRNMMLITLDFFRYLKTSVYLTIVKKINNVWLPKRKLGNRRIIQGRNHCVNPLLIPTLCHHHV